MNQLTRRALVLPTRRASEARLTSSSPPLLLASLLPLPSPSLLVILCVVFAWSPPAAAEPSTEQIKYFEQHVRPLLSENCLKCHGAKKQRGGLRLDSFAALLKGGESGAALVVGKPDESLLVQALKHDGLAMPPEEKLADAQIDAVVEWVRMGAPWPESERTIAPASKAARVLTDDDRQYWCFQPVRRVAPPAVERREGARSAVDAFILARLAREGIAPAPEADRRSLARRMAFDLTGLPPTADEIDAFVADEAPDAVERFADRLLASPRHGERWARHWLDLVRYAESDGFKQDDYRPNAWPYRDYVVKSFNRDKPYDQFVIEQLAGDEVAPQDPDALVATGYLRHWIYEYNQRDVRSQWMNILNDITDVTSDVFLGMGLGCARCHDHKFDPLLQRDYYRLQAFFTPLMPRDDLPLASPGEIAEYEAKLKAWEEKTADIRREMAELEREVRDRTTNGAIDKFPKDVRPMLRKTATERAPFEQQLAELAGRQIVMEHKNLKMDAKLKDEPKARWKELHQRLVEYDLDRPAPLPTAQAATDVGPTAPPTFIPGPSKSREIPPGFLSVLDPGDVQASPPSSNPRTTGRRLTLARWLVQPDQPLVPRVLVNRLWQHHFGAGLVRTSSDFGRLGEPPTHPELLDWLASRLVSDGWQLKPLHRELVTSATYRQSAVEPASAPALEKDPDNRWLWRMPIRRLDAEQIRDAALAVTGELFDGGGGPSVESSVAKRSIYVKVIRNRRDPLLEGFDAPDYLTSTAQRNVTTTPNQALLMINGPWALARAKALATDVKRGGGEPAERVERLYRRTLGRSPSDDERRDAESFLTSAGSDANASLVDLCHVLLNANEFLYVD